MAAKQIMMSDSTQAALIALDNGHIRWEKSFIGIVPFISNPATFSLIACAESIDAELVAFLGDEDRFAIAHVLLTQRHPPTQGFAQSAETWNELHVSFASDNMAKYDFERDHVVLQEQWRHLVE